MDKQYIHVTAGRGPAECSWVVAKLVKYLYKEAASQGFEIETINRVLGDQNSTLKSAFLCIIGKDAAQFCEEWEGSILWIGKSPYRKFHKRKNWFIGVKRMFPQKVNNWNERDLRFDVMRASGAGGQHVNKTESAVRAVHIPTGLIATSQDSRSQHQNKKLAIERLKLLLLEYQEEALAKEHSDQWEQHLSLERGNPVKTFEGNKFLLKK